VLGEVIAAIAADVQDTVDHNRASPGLLTAAAAGLLLVFAMWWSYIKHSAAEDIRQSLPWTFAWGLAHYLIFAAVAAVGAGLQVVIGTLTHSTRVSPSFGLYRGHPGHDLHHRAGAAQHPQERRTRGLPADAPHWRLDTGGRRSHPPPSPCRSAL
jgi:hypothetical protein